MSPRRPPSPDDLNDAPELAILAALEGTLELALRALATEHPQLGDLECPAWVRQNSPASEAAERILEAARLLATALEVYRRATTSDPGDPDLDRSF